MFIMSESKSWQVEVSETEKNYASVIIGLSMLSIGIAAVVSSVQD